MGDVLQRVIAIVSAETGIPADSLSATAAIDQDLLIAGGDVTDMVEALSKEFGEQVWEWPWKRFAMLDEGLPVWFPFMLVWQLLTWPVRKRFSYPNPYERLELGHIAAVIEKGEWFEP